jgi:hypothetical protein
MLFLIVITVQLPIYRKHFPWLIKIEVIQIYYHLHMGLQFLFVL